MNSTMKKITPKNDIVFKKIFGTKGNEGILKDFLEAILDIEIDSLTLDLNTEFLPEFLDGKKSRVDVRTRLADGSDVNIEMQVDVSKYSDKRCLQHWCRIYNNNIKKSEDYKNLRKTICIWILDGKIYDEFEDIDSKWRIMNEKYGLKNHFNELEIHIIELKKLRNSAKLKESKKNFWLWFIDHTNEELVNMGSVTNEMIKEAREQLAKIQSNEELMERIRLEEAYEMDYNTGINNARIEGKKEAQIETAKKMLQKGMAVEEIEELTGLSKSEIEALKN